MRSTLHRFCTRYVLQRERQAKTLLAAVMTWLIPRSVLFPWWTLTNYRARCVHMRSLLNIALNVYEFCIHDEDVILITGDSLRLQKSQCPSYTAPSPFASSRQSPHVAQGSPVS